MSNNGLQEDFIRAVIALGVDLPVLRVAWRVIGRAKRVADKPAHRLRERDLDPRGRRRLTRPPLVLVAQRAVDEGFEFLFARAARDGLALVALALRSDGHRLARAIGDDGALGEVEVAVRVIEAQLAQRHALTGVRGERELEA